MAKITFRITGYGNKQFEYSDSEPLPNNENELEKLAVDVLDYADGVRFFMREDDFITLFADGKKIGKFKIFTMNVVKYSVRKVQ
ncbi:hypothetical protein ABZ131_20940 [Providencia rettgeri]